MTNKSEDLSYKEFTQQILLYALQDRQALINAYEHCRDANMDIIKEAEQEIKLIKARMT